MDPNFIRHRMSRYVASHKRAASSGDRALAPSASPSLWQSLMTTRVFCTTKGHPMDVPAYSQTVPRRRAWLTSVMALAITLATGVATVGPTFADHEAGVEESPTLVGSDWTRELVYIEEEGPMLVGSGSEREFVYVEEVPTLLGSGSERELVYAEGAGVPTLVGSDWTREFVYVEEAAETIPARNAR